MLRKARIILSVVIFGLITFYFLDFAEILPNSFHRLAHIQFVPALMSLSFIILVVLVLITLLLGRIYCSTICPMGIFQDIVTWISKKTAKKKKRFRYSPAKNMLRWGVLGVTAIAFLFGFTVILGLLDPYSAFGRMTVNVFKPVYMLGNNLLESIFSSFNNYTFSPEYLVLYYRTVDVFGNWFSGMEIRAYLVQHNMPGRHVTRLSEPLLTV